MSASEIDYPRLTSHALRSVVASVLQQVAERGLPGDHFFYVSFRTDVEGVDLPADLQRKHPEEMTIVLQNQFWDLFADDERFAVTLSFGGEERRLTVPYAAMTAFVDPAAEFALRFAEKSDDDDAEPEAEPAQRPESDVDATVVQLDDFRPR